MQFVTPKVYLVAKTSEVDTEDFIKAIHADKYQSNAPSKIEKLIEFMGRLCYRSFQPLLNKNVTRIREDNAEYIKNILSSGHGSVLEHSSASFVFHNVSRVFTHELIRHRVGVGISQESLRYVRLEDINFWLPSCIEEHPQALGIFERVINTCEEAQKELAELYKLDTTKDFGFKKEITSAMRRVAPEGLATTIGWTGNMRILRHCIEMRTSRHAEEEIRLVFNQVAEICCKEWPHLFADYQVEMVNGYGEWTTPYSKV